MDFFQSSYYRLNERFLHYLGQWPLQPKSERNLYSSVTMLLVGSILLPQFIKFVECLGNLESTIRCLPALAIHARCITRFLNCRINAKHMSTLTNSIKDDWERSSADLERPILRRYAQRGKLMTIIYVGYIMPVLTLYLSLPFVPVILDVVSPLNRSRERIFLYETEYFVDPYENYSYITLHAWIAMPFAVAVVAANESMFGVYVNHACGIFATLGAHLASLGGNGFADEVSETKNHSAKSKDETYDKIVECIKIHKKALGYAELIESSCYFSQIFIIGANTLVVTLTVYTMVVNYDRPAEACRSATFGISVIIALFHPCWLGQTLINHSQNVFLNAYNVDWYNMTLREKKLLVMIMIRSAEPCRLTAGKIFVWSIESFGMALKTSMSYFTVLLSIQ